jgi:tetrahydromethanopterin S-methyltransferase subunit E
MTASPAEPIAQSTDGTLTGARAKALLAYIGLSGLLILGIWIAFILAGHGVFGLNGHNLDKHAGGKALDKQTVLDAHRAIGSILGLITILVLIAVAIARPGRKLVIWTVVLFLLAAIGQPAFAGIGEDHSWGGALHVLNAGVILVLAFYCHLTARKVPRA